MEAELCCRGLCVAAPRPVLLGEVAAEPAGGGREQVGNNNPSYFEEKSMADKTLPLRALIAELLMSDSVKKIDFKMYGFHVYGKSIGAAVLAAIAAFQAGKEDTGIAVQIDARRTQGGRYYPDTNELVFPDAHVGRTPNGRMT